jgi:hypothetical protein
MDFMARICAIRCPGVLAMAASLFMAKAMHKAMRARSAHRFPEAIDCKRNFAHKQINGRAPKAMHCFALDLHNYSSYVYATYTGLVRLRQ